MAGIVFIGDEVTAAGFALTGITVLPTGTGGLADQVQALKDECDLLLMTTEARGALPERLRSDIAGWTHPLVVFLPDIRNRVPMIDLDALARRELGIEM